MGIVYAITCRPTGQQYIGSSRQSARDRWQAHKGALRLGRGPRLLQAAYDLFGEDSFDFDVILETNDHHALETKLLRKMNPALNHAYTDRSRHEVRRREKILGGGRKRRLWEVDGQQLTGLEIIARYGKGVMARVYAGDPEPLRPRHSRTRRRSRARSHGHP